MSKMNQIKGFEHSFGIVTAEAGTILGSIQQYLSPLGYTTPHTLGSKGSCQIGGNLATNAGGLNFIKHNSLHANCIGLKAVLANGTILDNITTLRKDNTGYDMKHLFIGSEGTLGIITECALLCPTLSKSNKLVVLGCDSFEKVTKIL